MGNVPDSMAYRAGGGVPWHTLGNPVGDDVSVERMAIAANLEWGIVKTPVLFHFGSKERKVDGQTIRVPKLWKADRHHLLVRDDTGAVLDVVGRDYKPVQPMQALEFFREYVEAGDMRLETAGVLGGGKYVWAMAKMDRAFELPGGDGVQGYVLLFSPNLYGKGLVAKATMHRAVCENTITLGLRGPGAEFKLYHSVELTPEKRHEAARTLGIARERTEALERDARRLAATHLADDEALRVIAKVHQAKDAAAPLEKQGKTVQRVFRLYKDGPGAQLESAAGTAWGVLNAVTRYLDHEYGETPSARLTHSWLGGGEVRKRHTMTELLALAEAGRAEPAKAW